MNEEELIAYLREGAEAFKKSPGLSFNEREAWVILLTNAAECIEQYSARIEGLVAELESQGLQRQADEAHRAYVESQEDAGI